MGLSVEQRRTRARELCIQEFGFDPEELINDAIDTTSVEQPNEWKLAIDEAMVSVHIGVAEGDPIDCLNRLLAWHQTIALDPAVSSEAQALIDKGKLEERERCLRILRSVGNVYPLTVNDCIDLIEAETALEKLAEINQELGLGYD